MRGRGLAWRTIGDALGSRVTLGVVVGLVVGKLVGISGMSWLAMRAGLGELPEGVTWRHLVGGPAVAVIGFTVSLFIAVLAFDDQELVAAAKVGVLLGSLIAGVLGVVLLRARRTNTSRGGGGSGG
jgi:Na+:H+ antiporter, NhaA family